MKTYLECLPCFLKQAIQAGRIATKNVNTHKIIINEVAKLIPNIDMGDTPPKMGRQIHEIVKRITKVEDPYKDLKNKYNEIALSMYPVLKGKVKSSKDSLLTAVRIAIAGNVIDFGAQLEFELDKDVNDALYKDFSICDFELFKDKLVTEKKLLYLADNAGETVFDRVLIEEIHEHYDVDIMYAVKDKPIINDATKEDAIHAGIDKLANIISSGSDAPGTIFEYCNEEFIDIYHNSSFIISKGQGNYEALSEETKSIFFLFKVKCDVLAKNIKFPLGSIVLKFNQSERVRK